jgi:hypothetical protein
VILAGALLAALTCGADSSPVPPEEPTQGGEAFSWEPSYEKALEQALVRRRPVILFFPPASASEPATTAAVAPVLGSPLRAQGALAGAAEVESLVARFAIKELPAVLIVDRRQNVVARWEGRLPANLWSLVKQSLGLLARLEAEATREAGEGARLYQAGKPGPAYRKVAAVLASTRAPPEALEIAAEVERRLIADGESALIRVLAAEGLVEERVLRSRIAALRSAHPHPATAIIIEREMELLKRSAPGGKAP